MREELSLRDLGLGIRDSLTGMTCFPWDPPVLLYPNQLLFVTAECHRESRRMTWLDKLLTCELSSLSRRSSKTLVRDSTSRGKDLEPYWNDVCKEISSHLLSPTEIDSAGLVLNSLSSLSTQMVEKSWFSKSLKHHPKSSLPKTYFPSSLSSPVECMDLGGTLVKSKKIRLYPTKSQKNLFRQWFGVSRKFYNEAVNFFNTSEEKLGWMKLSTRLTRSRNEDYIKEVPYQIKNMAVKDAGMAFVSNCRKTKATGQGFRLSFRSKKDPVQSCFIPKSAIKDQGIYYTLSGKLRHALNYSLECKKDSRLVLENNRWFLIIPVEFERKVIESKDNIVSIDPGVRSFCTFFSTDGYYGHLGQGDFNRIYRLVYSLDKLVSKRDLSKNSRKRRSYNRSIKNLRFRLKNLTEELQNKVVLFLVKNFGTIIYPYFRTQDMVSVLGRRLRRKTVRMLLGWRFYSFEQKLVNKCLEYGRTLFRVSEAYTSRTNSFTGDLMDIGSREWFSHGNFRINRDVNGARGILLRALRDISAQRDESSLGCLVVN